MMIKLFICRIFSEVMFLKTVTHQLNLTMLGEKKRKDNMLLIGTTCRIFVMQVVKNLSLQAGYSVAVQWHNISTVQSLHQLLQVTENEQK
jgi:hypothetical protein